MLAEVGVSGLGESPRGAWGGQGQEGAPDPRNLLSPKGPAAYLTPATPPSPPGLMRNGQLWSWGSVCGGACPCARIPVWPVRAPHLLVVGVGQDAGSNLQQEDEEEQDEVLRREGRSEQGRTPPSTRIPSHGSRVAALSSQRSE